MRVLSRGTHARGADAGTRAAYAAAPISPATWGDERNTMRSRGPAPHTFRRSDTWRGPGFQGGITPPPTHCPKWDKPPLGFLFENTRQARTRARKLPSCR
ncbi:hypothetical protein GCM10010425_00600 [Streptomyces spororaveus]|uniref:Uncharacterized protein n=1 Tax=Streptomyces spororaveus TaxID=284039 RepID=A0ABQ3TCD3_9ACTN|nr:hypothetical protein Sspor_36390 [Streptomyces spororaveus]